MSMKMDKKRIASLAVFVIGILAVAYYILFKERVEFDSDFTDTVLWAEAMLTGNGIFDKTMQYAYTLPFGGSLLMAPFVAILGLGYKAHLAGFILFLAIFVFSLYKFLRALKFSVNETLVASAVIMLMSLPTKNTRMIMWGHVIHYSLGLLFVVIAIAICEKINIDELSFGIIRLGKGVNQIDNPEGNNKKNCIWMAVLAVATALFCTNGLTTILFFAVPFFGAVIAERFFDTEKELFCEENINTLGVTLICGVAGGIGFLASKVAQRGVVTVYDDMFKSIPMWQSWIWDVTERVRCFIVCIAGEINGEVPMESFTGIRILFMAFTGFVFIFVPLIAVFSYKEFENKYLKVFFLSYYILLFATLFVYDFSIARGTPHRLVGLYMTAVIATVVYMVWLFRNIKLQRFGFVLAVVLAVASLFSAYSVVALRGENRYDKLSNVLKENGLTHGYAEYWSAQVTTVLSEGDIVVCPVLVDEEGSVTPRYYNIRPHQYESEEGVDKYFLFFSAWEYEQAKEGVISDANEVITFDDDGYIVIFDHNIF